MFARTQRLLLRPGFPEDAPALFAAIGDEGIVSNLTGPPWPFRLSDAEAYLARRPDRVLPSLLIFERSEAPPQLIGECGLSRRPSGRVEIGYWIARSHWGRGFASEAAVAVVDIARALRLPALEASHFLDNARSGRILEKLGFQATGLIAPRLCRARGEELPARLYRLGLRRGRGSSVPVLAEREETLAA